MKPLILGAGLAGVTTALALAPMPVSLVSPCSLGQGCSSAWAQGGIAAAVGSDDSPELHALDTLEVGGGLNDSAIVTQTVGDGASIIENLISHGVAFDRDELKELRLGLEAAHKRRRIVHASDATGRAVMQALIGAVRQTESIEVIENAVPTRLDMENGAVAAVLLRQGAKVSLLSTNRVVLATGGAAALWRDTTNPHENWGGGLALAARAGASLGDLEFMQFHPTAIDIGRDPMPLASEALRGEGAILINELNERFTDELQARDIVTRAIWQQLTEGHRVFLDATAALGKKFAARFPTIYAICATAGIDPSFSPIPVRPAAHYHMGGVLTDARGRTDVRGLWACGEVACTGLHGANRLASNSLLEAASFGRRVAEDLASSMHGDPFIGVESGRSTSGIKALEENLVHDVDDATRRGELAIRPLLSDHVGVVRSRRGLQRTIDFLSPMANQSDKALVGLLVARAALRREESRGAHFRTDFLETQIAAQRFTTCLEDLEM